MLHSQIAARAKSMEGGGLMLPLKEATKHTATSVSRKRRGIVGYDGGDDDDDIDDEDAINSDLDDPEDEHDDDEVDDEGLGHIMLCMYDKVQRVKNKWKCTLKDGVLTVNGKEYVFHKATGEYEW
ncbi:Transcription initiation factor IIA large subunit [Metarhizium anisopliae]|nr:Transcription initiation factor IIA large subunit [Metarhizium anisopliae]